MGQEKKSETIVTVRPVHLRTMSDDSSTPRRFRDEEDDEILSQISSTISLDDMEAGRVNPRWYRFSGSSSMRWFGAATPAKRKKRRQWCRWLLIAAVVLGLFGVIAGITYVSFVGTLIARLAPPKPHSGLEHIVANWTEPDANGAFKYEWRDDFSRDIVPKNCHSHNDYWRRVPFYAAIAAGCTSVEADIWLTEESELRVGHSWTSTTATRTLRTLYLDPIANIFEHRNVSTASTSNKEIGMFDSDPNKSTILLIDFKSDGHKIWPVLQAQLQSFHEKGWLTYYDGTTLQRGPLTVVGTGSTPFELVQQNSTNRYIFYDAPLRSISEPQYNTTNSYYASSNLKAAIGGMWFGRGFTSKQEKMIKQQIQAADEKGLKSRFWDTPAWPISVRDSVWGKLMEYGVGVLNVDDLVGATRWNWNFCVIAGISLCGKT